MVLPASNSLNILELVQNELQKSFLRKYLKTVFNNIDLSVLKVNILEANN